MAVVGLLFGDGAVAALLLALLVGGLGEFVFHFAAEALFWRGCLWFLGGGGGGGCGRVCCRRSGGVGCGRGVMVAAVFVAAFGGDVGLVGHAEGVSDFLALVRG